MANRKFQIQLEVYAPSAREAVEELGGRSLGWLDDAVTRVRLLEEAAPAEDAASFDPADHPLAVRL